MTPAEAARLLLHAAAFDNRKPSTGAAAAWSAALPDMPLDGDTLNAVAAYYGAAGDPAERRWLQPHHVRHYRGLARVERITAANLRYDGQPGETGAESGVNLRKLITAAGDGKIPARPLHELTTGAQPAVTGRALLAIEAVKAAGEEATHPLPSRRAGVVNVLGVPCPICLVPAARVCQSRRRKHRADVHPARLEDARRIAAGQPPADRSQIAVEERQRQEAAARALALSGPSAFVPPDRAEAERQAEAAQ